MYSRDENVFIIRALFTYDYENICMFVWVVHMIVTIYVRVALA